MLTKSQVNYILNLINDRAKAIEERERNMPHLVQHSSVTIQELCVSLNTMLNADYTYESEEMAVELQYARHRAVKRFIDAPEGPSFEDFLAANNFTNKEG